MTPSYNNCFVFGLLLTSTILPRISCQVVNATLDGIFEESVLWKIQEPDFKYQDSQFILSWGVSDYIQDRFATFTLYDSFACKDGGNDITEKAGSFFGTNSSYFPNFGIRPDAATPWEEDDVTRGQGFRNMRLFLDIEPTVAQSPIFRNYTDNQNQERARVDFCIRFSLYNGDHSLPGALEVNYQETLVTFIVDLTDGFGVSDVQVKPKDMIERSAYVDCEIIAYECDRNNNRLDNPGYLRNQGREVRVCVELSEQSRADGLMLDRITWFYFTREDPQLVQQYSIVFDSQESPNGLAEYNCLRGVDICAFNTILQAQFFAWDRLGTVRGIGEGICTLGSSSKIAEDVPRNIGEEIMGWMHNDEGPSTFIKSVLFKDFPTGTTVAYTQTDGSAFTAVVQDKNTFNFTISGDEDSIRAAIDTLTVTAPLHSDADFRIQYIALTNADTFQSYGHPVAVMAIADPPSVSATESIQIEEDAGPFLLAITAGKSADIDNSEVLTVRIFVPSDSFGPVATIAMKSQVPKATLRSMGPGSYEVTSTGSGPTERETNLNALLADQITIQPRPHWSGVLNGTKGIRIEAVSAEKSDDTAPTDSVEWGTSGDMDTKNEVATTYTTLSVAPVNDMPYLRNNVTIVQENKLNSNVDEELIVQIGTALNMTVDDKDGSQYLDALLTGFPTNAIALDFSIDQISDSVTASVDKVHGAVSVQGRNSTEVLAVIESIEIILQHDDDSNFVITIEGTSKDSNGATEVSATYTLIHTVIVQAVADTPTLNIGTELKLMAAESSAVTPYPVFVRLNDIDGSERYRNQAIVLNVSTPTGISVGAPPLVRFLESPSIEVESTSVASDTPVSLYQWIILGSVPDLESAMDSLKIAPGAHNGEDITVVVIAASEETAQGDNEIAVREVEVVKSFIIPIDPVIQGTPVLQVPPSANGLEDRTFNVGRFVVTLNGTADVDESEEYFLEINVANPSTRIFQNTKFWVDNVSITGANYLVYDGWLRLPKSRDCILKIKPPVNFSGNLALTVRATIVDYSMSGQTTKSSNPQIVNVFVSPEAGDFNRPATSTSGVEDNVSVTFGNTLKTMKVKDNGVTTNGNNPETETFSRVKLTVPTDTSTMSYNITAGTFITGPHTTGTFSTPGSSAVISFDAATRTYDIFSTVITNTSNIATLSQANLLKASNDILNALGTFRASIGPEHNDLNGQINVLVTTLDVNIGQHNQKEWPVFTHNLIIQAVADAPSVFVRGTDEVDEDSNSISLFLNVTNSADRDGSEVMSVRITVPKESGSLIGSIGGNRPTGVTITNEGNGKYLIQATGNGSSAREALLNSFLSTGALEFIPRQNWAGNNTLRVDVISTESGPEIAGGAFGGADGDSKTETVTTWIPLRVRPVADRPDVVIDQVKANAGGYEDTAIPIAVSVTVTDDDGSETYHMEIQAASVPAGSKILGAGTRAINAVNGVYRLNPDDINALRIIPPLHYSTAVQGNITLSTTTVVVDSTPSGNSEYRFDLTIPVRVIGVSDKPLAKSVHVVCTEDIDYPIGQAIASALDGVLVDTDGSETLSLVIGGLPVGTILKTANDAGLMYIGNGEYEVDQAVISSLKVTPVINYSGENPFPNLKMRAISQEVDGDESISDYWTITFDVLPITDGFTTWGFGAQLSEEDNEVRGLGIALNSVSNFTLADPDSETVVQFTFDLSTFIADAGVGKQLDILVEKPNAALSDLINANLVSGVFSFDAQTGVLTALRENVGSMRIDSRLFKDSNKDFAIPVSALVKDTATIDGSATTHTKVESKPFQVQLVGTADVPTVYAENISGNRKILINLGGETTDTDVALGRQQSESIYYIVSIVDLGILPGYRFIDANNRPVGFDGGTQTWILPYEDVKTAKESGGLFFATRDDLISYNASSPPNPAVFRLMSVAVENDGDTATNTTQFTVSYSVGGGGSEDPLEPIAPQMVIGPNIGLEDKELVLDVVASPGAGDTTNPTISVLIYNLPQDVKVKGKYYFNYENGKHVALATSVSSGLVKITAPPDFGGNLSVTVEAVAVNAWLLSSTTGPRTANLYFDPVADSANIDIPGLKNGVENGVVRLPISIVPSDKDGSERIGDVVYVKVCQDASLIGVNVTNTTVKNGDIDDKVGGINVVGFSRIAKSSVSNLTMQPRNYWHGKCPVSVVAVTIETQDDQDLDYMKSTLKTFDPQVSSVPTPPAVTAPASVTGLEDTAIKIIGLSAALVDTVDANGHETLSAVITNVPEGSLFNFGSNSGDGRWAIPVDKLGTLQITPPENYAGNFTLTVVGISFDHASGTEASTEKMVVVRVSPVADGFYVLAKNVEVLKGANKVLNLTLRMDDTRGTLVGEVPPETMTITFKDVPTDISLGAPVGGSLTNAGNGTWVFKGSEAQANSIQAITTQATLPATHNISLTAFTTDGSSVFNPPIRDNFILKVESAQATSRTLEVHDDVRELQQGNIEIPESSSCGSEATVKWKSNDAIFSLAQYPITIDTQSKTSVSYSLPSSLIDPSFVNWAAIMFPADPQGKSKCGVPSVTNTLTYTSNCYDARATAYLFLNVGENSGLDLSTMEDAYVPKSCLNQVPSRSGKTAFVEISIPCTPCAEEERLLREGGSKGLDRRLEFTAKASSARVPKSKHYNRVVKALSRQKKSRALQDLASASEIKMEFTVSGSTEEETSSSGRLFALSTTAAAVVTSTLFMAFFLF